MPPIWMRLIDLPEIFLLLSLKQRMVAAGVTAEETQNCNFPGSFGTVSKGQGLGEYSGLVCLKNIGVVK